MFPPQAPPYGSAKAKPHDRRSLPAQALRKKNGALRFQKAPYKGNALPPARRQRPKNVRMITGRRRKNTSALIRPLPARQ